MRVFEYSTFRGLGGGAHGILDLVPVRQTVIASLISLKFGQPVRTREEVNLLFETHGRKKGTPTMGGVLIIGSVVIAALMWAQTDEPSSVAGHFYHRLSRRARVHG